MRLSRDDRGRGPAPSRNATWAPPRKRLLARLDRNSPITVIRAPQGYGKVDLVASWLESGRSSFRAVLWIPAPDAGVDSETYWQTVMERIRSTRITVEEPIADTRTVSSAEAVRECLARSGAPVLLVLARIDRVEDNGIEEEILHLLDRCHNVNIVATACGRSLFGDPVLMEPTHELILARDLLYTLSDAEELFAHAEIPLGPGELEYIHGRVGSIPALMRLAVVVAKSLPAVPDRRELLAHRLDSAIDRFVESSVLGHDAIGDNREFVIGVAPARVITPETARLLTGATDAAERLAHLESVGIVNHCETALSDAWEFAPAVRDRLLALQERTGRAPAHRLTVLARDAAKRGEVAGALSYAVEARDWDLVTELVQEHWVRLVGSHFGLLRATLREVPADLLESRPVIKAGRDLVLLLAAQQVIPGTTLPSDPVALEALGATAEATDALKIGCVQSLMLRLAGEHDRAADLTRRLSHLVRGALEARPDDVGPQLPAMRLQWGVTYQLAGAFTESAVELRLAHRGALGQRADVVARNAAGNSAMNWAVIGEPRRAEEWLELEDAHPDPDGWLEPTVKVGGLVARALVALDRLDFAAAGRYLDEVGEASEREELWPFVTYAHCRYALATGQAYTGMAVLQRATASHAGVLHPGSAIDRWMTALEVDLRLALGEGNRALAILEAQTIEEPLVVVTAARTHLLTGTPATALALCRKCDWFSYPYTRTQLEALLIEAAAHRTLGEKAAAARAWAHAVEIVDRTGLLSSLATVPRELLTGLDGAAPFQSPTVATFLASGTREAYPAAVHHVELTERENAVLAELAQGLSTLEIARKLFVSTNTVKSQLRSLYRKIDAHSRDEALEIAYRTGLID
ncbi:helix-turn-helix transcriptional regulator [Rhodococcus sp. SGAir0479]|uniref:helix-turn-helix transcriptional regulator n=1 Tax=Rhodococcus sp. SGAir0479 TaxID=2567884 RepID=UPI0010CD2756|nr:LuxR C-terminal-related transcriptional regulator [Rhodococcus sp. SGAir0479]QCQ92914.1 helix-turn-helix transcriptional regulator [Rhodococcus sp. SGAir0479]